MLNKLLNKINLFTRDQAELLVEKTKEKVSKESHSSGYHAGFDEGKSIGGQEGYKNGYHDGQAIGYQQGHQVGYDEAKTVVELAYRPAQKREDQRNCLFDSSSVGITEELANEIKNNLINITGANEPTDEQWQIILCNRRNVRVIAGAGSGKTTTMILRVLVLHYYLNIPIQEITVFSFTRKSALDFKRKLYDLSRHFDEPLALDQIKQCVTTFHSKLLKFACPELGINDIGSQIFEHIGKSNNEFSISGSNLGREQKEILELAYRELYQKDSQFKYHIDSIKDEYIRGQLQERDQNCVMKLAFQQANDIDETVCDLINGECFKWLTDDEQDNLIQDIEPLKINDENIKLRANAYIKEHNLYLFFEPKQGSLSKDSQQLRFHQSDKSTGFTLSWVNTRRITLLKHFFPNKGFAVIRSKQEWQQLKALLNLNGEFAPDITYSISGEHFDDPIHEYFYTFAQYIESLGCQVDDIASQILSIEDDDLPIKVHERHYLSALVLFWRYFSQILVGKGIYTYNQLFQYLSYDRIDKLTGPYYQDQAQSLKYCIIDEFQDISPLIVSWLQGAWYNIKRRAETPCLMTVGDDAQCIYTWRGSSPHYLTTHFDTLFPGSLPSPQFLLNKNFRSAQDIINSAESIFQHTGLLVKGKKGLSYDPELIGLCEFHSSYRSETVVKKIIHILQHESADCTKDEILLLVIGRTNQAWRSIKALLQKKIRHIPDNVKFQSIHQAKGLEANHVIVVGDAIPPKPCLIKNLICQYAGLPESYDKMQWDETKRLVYVAITRAKYTIDYYVSYHQRGVVSKNFLSKTKRY